MRAQSATPNSPALWRSALFAAAALLSLVLSFDAAAQSAAVGDNVLPPVSNQTDDAAHPGLTPFVKESNREDDLLEFRSPEAKMLWWTIVSHSQQDESGYYASGLKSGGEFVALAGKCFLAVYDAVFYVCPDQNVFERLTPSEVAGIQAGVPLSLPDGKSWMLVEAAGLHHGIYYSSFTAIVFSVGKGAVGSAKAFPLASEAENSDDPDSDTPCGEQQGRKENGFDDQDPGRIISHEFIKDSNGYITRISFTLLRQNCKSMQRTTAIEDYVYAGSDFFKRQRSVTR